MARPVRASESSTPAWARCASSGRRAPALATGFRALDTKLGGGLRAGELVIVAGRPAMGKTAFALNVACHAARGHSVLVLSLEMPKAQLHQRNLAMLAEVPLPRLRQPEQLGDEDWRRGGGAQPRGRARPVPRRPAGAVAGRRCVPRRAWCAAATGSTCW